MAKPASDPSTLNPREADPHRCRKNRVQHRSDETRRRAGVDSAHQIIVAAEVIGSGSQQAMLLPMIDKAGQMRQPHTLITADAGYHGDANVKALREQGIPAMIADNQMRRRDERIDNAHHKAKDDPLYDKTAVQPLTFFGPEDFRFVDDGSATCRAGKTLSGNGSWYPTPRGPRYQRFEARAQDCLRCHLRTRRQRDITSPRGRQVSRFEPKRANEHDPSERMRRAIDSPQGRRL